MATLRNISLSLQPILYPDKSQIYERSATDSGTPPLLLSDYCCISLQPIHSQTHNPTALVGL
jgi:hypothetical protein